MFDSLARGVARKPKMFIALWIVLVTIGAAGSLWGFGHGNLFARMSSSESMVPGSESDDVILATGSSNDGEQIVAVIEGKVLPADVDEELDAFRRALADNPAVATVTDPISIADQFESETRSQIESAVADALAQNQDLIDGAAAQAVAQNQDQINGAIALGGEAAGAQAREQIETAARVAATTQIESEARAAAEEQVAQLANPAEEFISDAGFVVIVGLEPGDPDAGIAAVESELNSLTDAVQDIDAAAEIYVNSTTLAQNAIMDQTAKDLVKGEAIGLPIALFLLLVVFGGVIAAGLPLGSALASIAIGLGLVWLITFITNVDSLILNVVSLIGLALSIDYGLLVVSRYREELALQLRQRGLSEDGTELPDDVDALVTSAVEETVRTAGRTVSFSALTIAFSIAGLLVINAPILKMIATGGVIIVMLAVATAVTLVPAVAKLLGARLVVPSKLSRMPGMRAVIAKVGDAASDDGFFSKLAAWVHARPWPVMIVSTLALIVMALPIANLTMRSNFIEYLPQDSSEALAYEAMQRDYEALRTSSATVVAYTDEENTEDFVSQIEAIAGVTEVRTAQAENFTTIDVFVDAEDQVGQEVTDVVEAIRGIDTDFDNNVGGAAALQLDFNTQLMKDAPVALAIIIVSVLVLLFLMTGSIIAPIKALIVNALSLLAGMGAGVFVFENGLLGMPETIGLETFVVASAIAFGFGLAMDYEVFLLARIKEYWDKGETNDRAVEMGLQRSGRIITSAAAIIIAVFFGFILGEMIPIKQIGVVLAFIIIVDATIVRMLLVPATMTVLDKWNWWAPAPLKKIYEKFKIVH